MRLCIERRTRRREPGPLTFEWVVGDLGIDGGELMWAVRTNKGWAHLRGLAHARDGVDHPFRADIYGPRSVGADGPARIALRIYDVDTDPNQASPIVKVQGLLDADAVELGREA